MVDVVVVIFVVVVVADIDIVCCPLAGGAKCRKTKREKAEKEMNGETEEEASLADEILVEEALEILYRK